MKLEQTVPDDVDFVPLWDYCLLLPIKKEMTAGGVVIPEISKGEDDLGTSLVVKAGPGTYRDNGLWVPNPLKPGDIVYHMLQMKPFKVKLKGTLYFCVAGRDVVATKNHREGQEQ